jgi:hypothetical protein
MAGREVGVPKQAPVMEIRAGMQQRCWIFQHADCLFQQRFERLADSKN